MLAQINCLTERELDVESLQNDRRAAKSFNQRLLDSGHLAKVRRYAGV